MWALVVCHFGGIGSALLRTQENAHMGIAVLYCIGISNRNHHSKQQTSGVIVRWLIHMHRGAIVQWLIQEPANLQEISVPVPGMTDQI